MTKWVGQREYMKKYYAENKDRIRDVNVAWRNANLEKHKARSRAYHHENRAVVLVKKRERWAQEKDRYNLGRRLRKFDLTLMQYQKLLNIGCAVCGSTESLKIDHCHETGIVRALLCHWCNAALGLMREDPERIRNLEYYAIDCALVKAQGMAAKGSNQGAQ